MMRKWISLVLALCLLADMVPSFADEAAANAADAADAWYEGEPAASPVEDGDEADAWNEEEPYMIDPPVEESGELDLAAFLPEDDSEADTFAAEDALVVDDEASAAAGDRALAAGSDDFTIEDGVLTGYNGPGGDVMIPEGVTAIGDTAFDYCDSLTSVTIPNGVTTIGFMAFRCCSKLASVSLPDSVTSIGSDAFRGCASLASISIPNGVNVINDEAFSYCTQLASVSLPDGVTCIEKGAFLNCESLSNIALPSSVTTIEGYAFDGCSSLTGIVLPQGITSIGESTFSRTGLTSIVIPEGVTSIGHVAFENCAAMSAITIPKSVTSIGSYVFDGCPNLTIRGYADSFAQTYAEQNGIPFVAIDALAATPAPTAAPASNASVSIPKKLSMGVKETYSLDVKASGATFKSSKASVADVSKKGVITAKKKGTAKITVSLNGKKAATCTVTVMAAPKSISLSRSSRKLDTGGAFLLTAKLPAKTASKITWTSSKKSIATVDANGVVTAVKKGTAKITAKTFNGKKATCKVTVSAAPSTLYLDQDSLSLGVKEKVKLKPVVSKGATAKYTWTSADPKIAKVSKKGEVTGVKAGTTKVTVKTQNGLSAEVTVKVQAVPKKVSLNKKKAELAEGATLQLVAKLTKGTTSELTWRSSDKKVARVDDTGLVTAVAPGTAKITVETFNGKKDSCTVAVREATIEDHFMAILDMADSSALNFSDLSDYKLQQLSVDDSEDLEDMLDFIEEYNALNTIINAEIDAYQEYLEGLSEAMGKVDDILGETVITDTEEGIQIKNNRVSFTIEAISSDKNVAKGARIVYNEDALLIPKAQGSALVSKVSDGIAWLDYVGQLIDVCHDWFDLMEIKIDQIEKDCQIRLNTTAKEVQNTMDALDKATRMNKKKAMKKQQKKLNTLKPVYEQAEKALKAVQQKNTALQRFLSFFKKLADSHAAAALSFGIDLKAATIVDAAMSHGHPVGRETVDSVRFAYAQVLDKSIQDAENVILSDLSFNAAQVLFDLLAISPEGAGGKVCTAMFGKTLALKLNSMITKITTSKFAKNKLVGATGVTAVFAGGLSLGITVEKATGIVQHYEDILHGNIRGVISGKVIDSDTKKPIEGVMVQMGSELFSGFNTQAPVDDTTKADGTFIISSMYGDYSGEYSLWFYKEGYVTAIGEAQVDEDNDEVIIQVEMKKSGIPIDKEHFPDAIFRSIIKDYDLDGDNLLSVGEIAKIKSMTIDDCSIASLAGIQYLVALESMSCNDNQLTNLNVSECKALKTLYCDDNKLTSLNVDGCTALQVLYCVNNQLSGLNISGNRALKTLYCGVNKFSSLDVSGCKALKTLYCYDNKLTSLNVDGCTALQVLYCRNNQLSGLNISGNRALKALYCERNRLTSLDVSGCSSLERLECRGNELTSLNASGCTALVHLSCNENKLESLNVSGCKALNYLDCGSNQLTGLNVNECTALTALDCSYNQLTSLNVNGCSALVTLSCGNNKLMSLNANGCKALNILDCAYNQLTGLNVSGCSALAYLLCHDNKLTGLNVSGCSALATLWCQNNKLKSLNVSECPALKLGYCEWYNNPMTDENIKWPSDYFNTGIRMTKH